jgi:hypothetical protein
MRAIKTVGLIVLGAVLGIAGNMANARIEAQAPAQEIQIGQPAGPIITGENLGFQLIAGRRGDVATGKLMVKIGGRWLPAATPMVAVPAR